MFVNQIYIKHPVAYTEHPAMHSRLWQYLFAAAYSVGIHCRYPPLSLILNPHCARISIEV